MSEQAETITHKSYRYYVLFVLAMTYAFSFMDRQIVSILLGDLKVEFDLNDTQLGLLSGLAFALFYSTLALPIARYADRANRVNIIAMAVGLWSLVTAFCGLVQNFWQLFLGRVGVGVGEAGGLAPAHSVLSDYFDEHERALALSLYSLGIGVGAFMGLALGGYIAQEYGWRMAFIVAGLPGILLAFLVSFTIREPQRGTLDSYEEDGRHAPIWATIVDLAGNRVYRNVVAAHVLVVFTGYSFSAWLPQHILRSFPEVSQAQVGTIIGLVFLIGAVGGMLSGGLISNYFGRKFGKGWQLRPATYGVAAAVPVYIFALATDNFTVAVILFIVGGLLIYQQHGPGLAVVQSSVKPSQRAFAASLNFFFSNFLGLGIGPLLVGAMSDALAPSVGNQSLSYALMASTLFAAVGFFVFWRTCNEMDKEA